MFTLLPLRFCTRSAGSLVVLIFPCPRVILPVPPLVVHALSKALSTTISEAFCMTRTFLTCSVFVTFGPLHELHDLLLSGSCTVPPPTGPHPPREPVPRVAVPYSAGGAALAGPGWPLARVSLCPQQRPVAGGDPSKVPARNRKKNRWISHKNPEFSTASGESHARSTQVEKQGTIASFPKLENCAANFVASMPHLISPVEKPPDWKGREAGSGTPYVHSRIAYGWCIAELRMNTTRRLRGSRQRSSYCKLPRWGGDGECGGVCVPANGSNLSTFF